MPGYVLSTVDTKLIKTGKISSPMKVKWMWLLSDRNKGYERWYDLSKVAQQSCYQVGLTPKS